MENTVELKRCPFCGGEKLKVEGKTSGKPFAWNNGLDYRTYTVRCNKCHARGSTASGYTRNALYRLTDEGEKILETPDQIFSRAIEAWNRRTDDESSKSM